jgi:uncharacterized membrane protein YcaP (DUF421 family)
MWGGVADPRRSSRKAAAFGDAALQPNPAPLPLIKPQQIESAMWHLSVPWWELVLRGLVVYSFLILILRITGKRQVGQLAPFDLVLLLVLANAVQNSMNAGDNSLLGGLIIAATLVGLNYVVGLATFKNKQLEAIIEGRPQVLIHNGRLFEEVMARSQLTHHELNAALRGAACASVQDVHSAILENNGSITVISRQAMCGNEAASSKSGE